MNSLFFSKTQSEEKKRGENADHQWSLIHIGVTVIDFPLCGICL